MKVSQWLPGVAANTARSWAWGSDGGRPYLAYGCGNLAVIVSGALHVRQQINCGAFVTSLACAQRSRRLAVSAGNNLLVFSNSVPCPSLSSESPCWEAEGPSISPPGGHVTAVAWFESRVEECYLVVGTQQLSVFQWPHSSPSGIVQPVWTEILAVPPHYISTSPDGMFIATAGRNDPLVKVWYRTSRSSDSFEMEFLYLRHPVCVHTLSWRPHQSSCLLANVLLTHGGDGVVRLWKLEKTAPRLRPHLQLCSTLSCDTMAVEWLCFLAPRSLPMAPQCHCTQNISVSEDEEDLLCNQNLPEAGTDLATSTEEVTSHNERQCTLRHLRETKSSEHFQTTEVGWLVGLRKDGIVSLMKFKMPPDRLPSLHTRSQSPLHLFNLRPPLSVLPLCFSHLPAPLFSLPEGIWLIASGIGGILASWTLTRESASLQMVSEPSSRLLGHSVPVVELAAHSLFPLLASLDMAGSVRVWKTSKTHFDPQKIVFDLAAAGAFCRITWAPKDPLLLAYNDRGIHVYELAFLEESSEGGFPPPCSFTLLGVLCDSGGLGFGMLLSCSTMTKLYCAGEPVDNEPKDQFIVSAADSDGMQLRLWRVARHWPFDFASRLIASAVAEFGDEEQLCVMSSTGWGAICVFSLVVVSDEAFLLQCGGLGSLAHPYFFLLIDVEDFSFEKDISAEPPFLATGHRDGTLRLWALQAMSRTCLTRASSPLFRSDKALDVRGQGRGMKCVRLGALFQVKAHSGAVEAVVCAGVARIATASRGEVIVWEALSGAPCLRCETRLDLVIDDSSTPVEELMRVRKRPGGSAPESEALVKHTMESSCSRLKPCICFAPRHNGTPLLAVGYGRRFQVLSPGFARHQLGFEVVWTLLEQVDLPDHFCCSAVCWGGGESGSVLFAASASGPGIAAFSSWSSFKLFHELSYELLSPLPLYHPRVLLEYLKLGSIHKVGRILEALVTFLEKLSLVDTPSFSFELSIEQLLNTKTSFEPEMTGLEEHLCELLGHASLPGLEPIEQAQLLGVIIAVRTMRRTVGHLRLDECSLRFSTIACLASYLRRVLPPKQRPGDHSAADFLWALHSETQEALVSEVLGADSLWERARELGVGFWVRSHSLARFVMERIAKVTFVKDKNPGDTALFYIMLGKKGALAGLYRATKDTKLAKFLSRDFAQARWKNAALKNAFVLQGQHRYRLAAAFFLLAGPEHVQDAIQVCLIRLKDPQLALFVAKLTEKGETGVFRSLIKERLLPAARDERDPCMESVLLWLLGEYEEAVESLFLGSSYPSPALLPIFRFLRSLPVVSTNRDDALLKSQAIYSYYHSGCQVLGLELLSSQSLEPSPPLVKAHPFQETALDDWWYEFSMNASSTNTVVTSSHTTPVAAKAFEVSVKEDPLMIQVFVRAAFHELMMIGILESLASRADFDYLDTDYTFWCNIVHLSREQLHHRMWMLFEVRGLLYTQCQLLLLEEQERIDRLEAAQHNSQTKLFETVVSEEVDLVDSLNNEETSRDISVSNTNILQGSSESADFAEGDTRSPGDIATPEDRKEVESMDNGAGQRTEVKIFEAKESFFGAGVMKLLDPILFQIRSLPQQLLSSGLGGTQATSLEFLVRQLVCCLKLKSYGSGHRKLFDDLHSLHILLACYVAVFASFWVRRDWEALHRILVALDPASVQQSQHRGVKVLKKRILRCLSLEGFEPSDHSKDIEDVDVSDSVKEECACGVLLALCAQKMFLCLKVFVCASHRLEGVFASTLRYLRLWVEAQQHVVGRTLVPRLPSHIIRSIFLNPSTSVSASSGGEELASFLEETVVLSEHNELWKLLSLDGGHLEMMQQLVVQMKTATPTPHSIALSLARPLVRFHDSDLHTSFCISHDGCLAALATSSHIREIDLRLGGAPFHPLPPDQQGSSPFDVMSPKCATKAHGGGSIDSGSNLSEFRDDEGGVNVQSEPFSELSPLMDSDSDSDQDDDGDESSITLGTSPPRPGWAPARPGRFELRQHSTPTFLSGPCSDPPVEYVRKQSAPPSLPVTSWLQTSSSRLSDHRDMYASCLAAHPSLPFYLSGGLDGNISLWQYTVSKRVATYSFSNTGSSPISRIRFSLGESKFGACDNAGSFGLWHFCTTDPSHASPFCSLRVQSRACLDFTFLRSCSLIAAAGSSRTPKRHVGIWDTLLPQDSACVWGTALSIQATAIAYAPVHSLLLVGDRHGTLYAYDLRKMALIQSTPRAHLSSIRSLCVGPYGDYLFSCSSDGSIKIWQLPQLSPLHSLDNAHARKTFVRPALSLALHNPMMTLGVSNIGVALPQHAGPSDVPLLYSCGSDGRLMEIPLRYTIN